MKRAKDQLKANMVLGLEARPVAHELTWRGSRCIFGRFFTADEITAEVDRVSAEDIHAAGERSARARRTDSDAAWKPRGLKIERDRTLSAKVSGRGRQAARACDTSACLGSFAACPRRALPP